MNKLYDAALQALEALEDKPVTTNIELVRRMVSEAAIYCSSEQEAIRIIEGSDEDDYFQGVGEETGETYRVYYEEVDIDYDLFYKLVPMKPVDFES